MHKLFLTAVLAITTAGKLYANTYYVSTNGSDSSNGAAGTPWLTVGLSIAKLQAGDTLIINSGTYVESSSYTFSISGLANSPITINGSGATIDIHSTGGQHYNFNGNYVVVDGLKFKMTLASGMVSGGVLGINGNNCIFRNLEIYNISAALVSGSTGDQLYCVVSGGGSSLNTCSNLFIHDIKDGDIFRIWGYTNRLTSCIISNCSNPNYNYSGSSQLHADCYQSFGDNNTPSVGNVMSGNYFVNDNMQFVTISQDSRSNIHDNVWENNIFVNIATCSFMGQHNTLWYNNLFINCGANPGCALRVDGGSDATAGWDAAGSQIINNAFITYSINFIGGLSASQFLIANNYFGTASFGALGAIGTAAINGGNPQFAGPSDYHILASSVFRGAGMNLSGYVNGPTVDRAGNIRSANGNWDIGPYQFGGASSTNPLVVLTPTSLNFGVVSTNETVSQNLIIQNADGGLLIGTATVLAPFSISNGVYNLGLGQSQPITIKFSPSMLGSTNRTIIFTFAGDGATNLIVVGIGTNASPYISPITTATTNVGVNPNVLQIFSGTTVVLSATATNESVYQWSYTVNGGSPIVYQSGTGPVPNVSMNYGTNTTGNNYVWTLTVSNGQFSAQSQFPINVIIRPQNSYGYAIAANSGAVTAPFTFGTNVVAGITNIYLYQPNLTATMTNAGSAIYNFTITNAGIYVVLAIVNAPDTGANSFWVNMDGQPQDPTMIWDIPVTAGFEQVLVSWRGSGTDTANQFAPIHFNLTTGPHQIIFRGREANAQLRSFSILPLPSPPTGLKQF